MEDVGSEVLGGGAVANPAGDVGVHAIKVQLVEFAEAGGILLRSLDQETLVGVAPRPRRCRFSHLCLLNTLNGWLEERLRRISPHGCIRFSGVIISSIRLNRITEVVWTG